MAHFAQIDEFGIVQRVIDGIVRGSHDPSWNLTEIGKTKSVYTHCIKKRAFFIRFRSLRKFWKFLIKNRPLLAGPFAC